MADWNKTRVGDFLILEYGKPLDKDKRKDNGLYPAYGANGVKCWSDEYHYDKKTIIVGRKGSAGEITLTEEKFWPLDVTYFVKFDHSKYDLMFVFHLLSRLDLPSLATGVKPGINRNNVYAINVQAPNLPEQKRIVAILDQVFADIEQARAKTEQNLLNARELFESYLQQVFSPRGEGWVETKLGDLFDIGSSKRIYETDWAPSGVPFFGGKEIVKLAKYETVVSNAYISEEKYLDYASKYDMPQKGDILMTARGTIGVGYIVKEGDKFYYKDGNIISLRQKTPTSPQFILYAFRSKQIVDQIEGLTGTTVNHLPLKKAKEIALNIPNYHVQNESVLQIKKMETNIQHLAHIYERKLLSIDELKKSILHLAFTGQLTHSLEPTEDKGAAA